MECSSIRRMAFKFIKKKKKKLFPEIMKESLEFLKTYKTPFYAWFGPTLCIILDDPDDVETVLNSKSCIDKAAAYKYFYRDGLFTAPGNSIYHLFKITSGCHK